MILEIIAQIQANPLNVAAYRNMAKYFQSIGKKNEADAILKLIKVKLNGPDNPNNHQK